MKQTGSWEERGFQRVSLAGEPLYTAPVATFRSLVQYAYAYGVGVLVEGRLSDLSGQSPTVLPHPDYQIADVSKMEAPWESEALIMSAGAQ